MSSICCRDNSMGIILCDIIGVEIEMLMNISWYMLLILLSIIQLTLSC